ncbi:phosphatase domain-containing protein [Pseudonocardia broussonetiae]|uniref:phosphatase domain-containing protein n=1 Tax=Pseudonocardia broussonetiae TaxID=2736640 RepID=UPI00196634A2|nr:phosphatase domain-containing protein [Pseudonocardia broussonetiae]
MDDGARAVVFDVDGVLRWGSLRRLVGRLRALGTSSPRDRRSMLAMPRVVRALSVDLGEAPVHYVTGFPALLARPITDLLRRDGYPSGTVLTTGRGPALGPAGRAARKLRAVESIADRMPGVRWVLLGDDGGTGPQVFAGFAQRRPDRVALIALRRVFDDDHPATRRLLRAAAAAEVPVVGAPNGEELLPLARAALGIGQPRRGSVGDWFLSGPERRNSATRLQPWTEGNSVRALVHGRSYYAALARSLAVAGGGDSVQFVGWRADADQLLDDGGPTVGEALSAAARRGAAVRGLLWHAHSGLVGLHLGANRVLARAVGAAGGEVLLDQRVLAFGCHHQKMVVVRYRGRRGDDVAYIGGIDLDHGSRDDADHRGDRQSVGADPVYGPNPAYHDVQLMLHGPVVGEAEETFRERWTNPAALSRLPWQVVPDWFHRTDRTASPLAPAAPAPPPDGTCAVQLLRTYPRRRPRYPYAPRGERSIALAYTKALGRAERLIYVEDQYLWSFDVARIFAAALQRSSRLHLIAVVPRRPDNENPFYTDAALLGHAEALAMVREAGGDRVQVLDVENVEGRPVYVHSKLCVVDDVWAAVGSDNFNTRSWTHDSELTAAVVDAERDDRAPTDPGGLGDGARRFARGLRLTLLREHLGVDEDDALLDAARAADAVRRSAAEVDLWHAGGCRGPRPAGRLRSHSVGADAGLPAHHRWFTAPVYRSLLDPDGRPLDMRLRRTY